MLIHFVVVTGDVAVDDRVSFTQARSGMDLETGGRPHIILTGDHSTASFNVGDRPEIITLRANSVLHVHYPRPTLVESATQNLRLLAGKLWSKIDKGEWKPETWGSGGGGIRG